MKKVPKLRILVSLVMMAALVALTVVPVLAQPPVTSPLIGSVKIDNVNAPVGTKVDVFVGTETTARALVTTTVLGQYDVVVMGAAADVGKALIFKVNNMAATTTPVSPTFASYQPQVVNLAATTVSYTLTVTISPSGSGTVTRNPDLAGYSANAVVTLTANPGAGYTFSSWSGTNNNAINPTTVTINANKSVTATFVATYTLTVTVSGSGSVTKNPDLAAYPAGTVVTLTANPGAGYAFSSWSGAVTGTANPTTVTMNSNKSVTATFVKYPVLLWWLNNR